MTKFIYKAGAAIATAAFMVSTFAGVAFAVDGTPTCEISGNGNKSTNTCIVVKKNVMVSVKKNKAVVGNIVLVGANTGGNSASGNTGGSTTVDSGNATVTVTINNTVNQNN